MLIHAFNSPRIDYCNAIFSLSVPVWSSSGNSKCCYTVTHLVWQKVPHYPCAQTSSLAPCSVQNLAQNSHPLLPKFAWPGPTYVSELLYPDTPAHYLRSGSLNLLSVSRTCLKTHGDQAFQSVAPKWWKAVPAPLSLAHTKRFLKS